MIAECLRAQSTVSPRGPIARVLGRSPLSDDSRPWYLGALGELDVGERLRTLGPEWTVLHSVPVGTRGSDIDHLIVGPAGVFTINTKFHEGARVWIGSRRLLVNGQRTEHLRNARHEATRLERMLAGAIGSPVPVSALIVLVKAGRITVKSQPEDVTVLRERDLARWLRRRPVTLLPDELARVSAVLTSPSSWEAGCADADLSAFARLRSSVHRAHRVRTLWALGALSAPVAVLTATALSLFAP